MEELAGTRGEATVALNLATVEDAILLDYDAALLNRLTYVASLVRLNQFIRRRTTSFAEEEAQAKLSVAYIKNLEGNRLSALQIGRSGADLNLVDKVAELRAEIARVSDYKAKGLAKIRAKDLAADQAAHARGADGT